MSKLEKAMGRKAGSQWMRTEGAERKQKAHRLFHRSSTVLHNLIQRSSYIATRAQDLRQGAWPIRSADATSIIARLAHTPDVLATLL